MALAPQVIKMIGVRRKNKKFGNWRISFVFLLLCLIFFGVIYRFFYLQVLNYKFYSAKASDQHDFSKVLDPVRGSIYMKDRFGDIYPLAINKDSMSVYAVPKEIIDKDVTAQKLADILNVEKEEILGRVSKENDPYEPIKSKISDEEAGKIKNEQLKGIYISGKEGRFYPYGNVASSVVGFVASPKNKFIGQYGLEKFYNEKLSGENGILAGEKGVGGAIIFTASREYRPALDGADLVLTIDPNIQFKAEEILRGAIEKWEAEKGTIIISNPKTGAIKAMASYPDFDLNEYSKVKDAGLYMNPAVQSIFEPGSVIKPITMAIGIDQKAVSPETKYIDEGVVQIGGYKITNFDDQAHGEKTMREVLQMSLNTGVVFVEKKIAKPVFKDYFEKFGFSGKTDIDLPGEVKNNISNLNANRDINYATASFGQGIAITPIQLMLAIGALANHGKLMKPYIIDEFKSPAGQTQKIQPREVGQAVSPETAEQVASMLVDVVKKGYDKKAGVDGYTVAGKTGTAQIPDGKGGYSDEMIHSFIGFAPAYNPEFLVLIKIDKPKGNRFAANTLSPFFGEMMNYLLSYYEVPPDDKTADLIK